MNVAVLFHTPLIWLGFLSPNKQDAAQMGKTYNNSPYKFPYASSIQPPVTTANPKRELEKKNTDSPLNISTDQNDRPPQGIGTIPPLIPRQILLGYPDYVEVKLSPDGQFLSYLAPFHGFMNIWLVEFSGNKLKSPARPVTHERKQNVDSYYWLYDNRTVLYLRDTNGDENWHLTTCDVISGEVKNVISSKKVRAYVFAISHLVPEKVAIGLNDRDPRFHDPYLIDVKSGKKQLLFQNDHFSNIYFDMLLRPRLAEHIMPRTADKAYYFPDEKTLGNWSLYRMVPRSDSSTTPFQFDASGKYLFWLDSTNRDKAALIEMNFNKKRIKIIHDPKKSDVTDVLFDGRSGRPLAALVSYEKSTLIPVADEVEQDLKYLHSISNDTQVLVTSTSLDGSKWLVPIFADNESPRYYFYDRKRKLATLLFPLREKLSGYPLAKMHPKEVRSRDGLVQLCYLSIPLEFDPGHSGMPNRPLPMVLLVHGGPWERDSWGFSGLPQLLANRGYGVLQCNFRGSAGFGNSHLNAGDGEWGGKILEDLVDAVKWSVDQGIANPNTVAIMGGSFGGYATLAALAFYPKLFACGVDIVGPSNLVTLLNSIPAYWKPELDQMIAQIGGDPRTPEGRKFLESQSPLFAAHKIEKPLLIAQGQNDPRVSINESDQIVEAMKNNTRHVSYVIFPDEGHGFARQENNLLFTGVTELFLRQCIRGRAEPLRMIQGAHMEVGEAGDIPELANFPTYPSAENRT